MLRAVALIFLGIFIPAFATGSASAGKRVALVIGNGAYVNAPPLANPGNDAEDMAAALKAMGFEVILGTDLDKRSMDRKILEFAGALSGAEVGVFHYSGHGLQVAGVNYLVPVDASLESAASLDFEAVPLGLIQRTMEREAKTNILFLDACRNNPLTRNLARAFGTRSAEIGHGLASMESGAGTLISFSTQPGNVALDGQGRNSPYSGPLVKAIGTPGEDVLSMLTGVRNAVMAATGDKQVPWEHSALRAKFFFNPSVPADAQQAQFSEPARVWAEIKEQTDPALFETFRKLYGPANPLFDKLAEQRITALRKLGELQPQAAPPKPAPEKVVKAQPLSPLSEAAQAWDRIRNLKTVAVFEAFRKQYGTNAVYDALAAQRIEALKRAQPPVKTSQTLSLASPPSDDAGSCSKVAGSWGLVYGANTIILRSTPFPMVVKPDGTGRIEGRGSFSATPFTWTCSGNVFIFGDLTGITSRMTISADGMQMSGPDGIGVTMVATRTPATP